MKRCILLVLSLFYIIATCYAKESLSLGENISVSPSTGQLRYELPLYTISNPDFRWPIALSYTSDGFHPYDYSFPVGSGWNLIADGVITREVIGVPDDLDTVVGYFPYPYDIGYLTYVRNLNIPKYQDCDYRDVGSDIYTFSFGPYSGSFIFDSVGTPQIISGDFLYVDASGVSLQENLSGSLVNNWLSLNSIRPSCFVLTTLDGYKYYFGSTNSTNTLEYGGSIVEGSSLSIVAWHLQKIVAPNGNALIFHYRTSAQPQWKYDMSYSWVSFYNYQVLEADLICSDTLNIELLSANYFAGNPTSLWFRYVLLDSITTSNDGLKISFLYSWGNNNVFDNPSFPILQPDSVKPFLSSVQTRVGNTVLHSWTFDYTNIIIGDKSYKYLASATNGCDNTHSFSYDFPSTSNWPDISVSDIDVYGYYRNYPKFGSLISSSNSLGSEYTYSYSRTIVDSVRMPSFEQGQWVSKTVFYDKTLCNTIKLSDVIISDGEINLVTKHYNYGEDEMGAVLSPPNPGNGFLFNHTNGVLTLEKAHHKSNGPTFMYTPFQLLHAADIPITFSQVTESVCDVSGSIQRKVLYTYQLDSLKYRYNVNNYSFIKDDALAYYQTNLWYRLLRNVKEFDGSSQLVNEKTSNYVEATTNCKYIYYRNNSWRNVPSSKYFCSYKTEVRDQINCSSSFVYDSKFRLTFQSQTQGSDTRFIRMVYPDNLSNNIPNGMVPVDSFYFSNMVLKNFQMVGEPIEQYGGYIENDIEYVTNGTLVLKNIVYPQNPQQTIVTIRTFALHPTTPISSYTPVHTGNCHVLYNENYDTVSVSRYQKWNRLVWEKSKSDALGTSYQWSSDLLYPISKTIGGRTWSYSYTPYVGITSETSPRGLIIGYQYDNCGRLEEKYIMNNEQKEILEHYVYH